MSDWRLQNQDKYLKGVRLHWSEYRKFREGWEHDHCEFCSRKFSETGGELSSGYTTEDRYHWVCSQCFEDFKTLFEWVLGQ